MYEKYMIAGQEIENVMSGGIPSGISVPIRVPYYGISLSRLDHITAELDGVVYGANDMTLTVDGYMYSFADMETMATTRWEFGQKAVLFIPHRGGLYGYGRHNLSITIGIVVAYKKVQTATAFCVIDMLER